MPDSLSEISLLFYAVISVYNTLLHDDSPSIIFVMKFWTFWYIFICLCLEIYDTWHFFTCRDCTELFHANSNSQTVQTNDHQHSEAAGALNTNLQNGNFCGIGEYSSPPATVVCACSSNDTVLSHALPRVSSCQSPNCAFPSSLPFSCTCKQLKDTGASSPQVRQALFRR